MSRKQKITILAAIIILSITGGIAGGVLVRSYFVNAPVDIPLFGDINLGREYQQGNVIISQPKKVVVEQDDRIKDVVGESRKKMVDLYIKKETVPAAENRYNINNYYLPESSLGTGLILTNDGWIITAVKISRPEDFIAVDYNGEVMEVEEVFFDKAVGYYFIKITAHNLIAAQFAEEQNIFAGQMLLAVDTGEAGVFYIENSAHNSGQLIKSSENFYNFIKINGSDLKPGDILFNLDGSVVGLYFDKELVTPVSQLTVILPGLLSENKISRPMLGVRYITFSGLIGAQKLPGALIARDTGGVAIVKSSPAFKAGLKEGDIILEVDGSKVEKYNTLSKLIQRYRPGKEIELKILRNDEEINIKVVLASQN